MSDTWTHIFENGVSTYPAPLSKASWRDLYIAYDAFNEFMAKEPQQLPRFNDVARQWQVESGLKKTFSCYFSPYYRDTRRTAGKDNKCTFQFCEPYYRYLHERDSELLEIESYRRLIDASMARLLSSWIGLMPLMAGLREIEPALHRALFPEGTMPPVALRLIRYAEDEHFATNPHVDKSALTMILDTDEDANDSRRVFGPIQSDHVLRLSQFSPMTRPEGESLVFLGAAPSRAGYTRFAPAPHAVRPVRGPVRHVAILFWLLPNIDLEEFDTTVPFVDDIGNSRPVTPKYGVRL